MAYNTQKMFDMFGFGKNTPDEFFPSTVGDGIGDVDESRYGEELTNDVDPDDETPEAKELNTDVQHPVTPASESTPQTENGGPTMYFSREAKVSPSQDNALTPNPYIDDWKRYYQRYLIEKNAKQHDKPLEIGESLIMLKPEGGERDLPSAEEITGSLYAAIDGLPSKRDEFRKLMRDRDYAKAIYEVAASAENAKEIPWLKDLHTFMSVFGTSDNVNITRGSSHGIHRGILDYLGIDYRDGVVDKDFYDGISNYTDEEQQELFDFLNRKGIELSKGQGYSVISSGLMQSALRPMGSINPALVDFHEKVVSMVKAGTSGFAVTLKS